MLEQLTNDMAFFIGGLMAILLYTIFYVVTRYDPEKGFAVSFVLTLALITSLWAIWRYVL